MCSIRDTRYNYNAVRTQNPVRIAVILIFTFAPLDFIPLSLFHPGYQIARALYSFSFHRLSVALGAFSNIINSTHYEFPTAVGVICKLLYVTEFIVSLVITSWENDWTSEVNIQ